MDYLTIVTPEGASERFELAHANLKIGRSSTSDLVLQDLNVSRLHAELVKRSDGYFVLDAGGKNGTYVNDRRIESPTLLKPGDRVRLGATTLVFNGTPSSNVEFSDVPLPQGPGTIHLSADDLKTPNFSDMSVVLKGTPAPLATIYRGTQPGVAGGTPTPSPELTQATLNVILEADKELVFHRPINELLEMIMDLAHRAVRFERGLLMLLEGGEVRPHVVRVPPAEAGRTISLSRTIIDRVMKNQEAILTSDALLDDRFKAGQSVEIQQIRSLMCAPLWNNRDVIGLIYLDSRQRSGLFTRNDLTLLTHLANVAAVKIENARLFEQAVAAERMEQEIQNAAEIQNHLLPTEGPPIDGYEVFGTSLMCRAVGGDYYDYVPLEQGQVGIALGDVAGKGLPAALLMASLQASLRALSEMGLPPDDMLNRLNRLLCRTVPENRFVTFFYSVLDPKSGQLLYVNAGQNPPYLVRAEGPPEELGQTGPPLGLFDTTKYRSRTARLDPGDILVCYSDGVTEARGPTEEDFGEARLTGIVGRERGMNPTQIIKRVIEGMAGHCAGRNYQDDVTLVVLKRGA